MQMEATSSDRSDSYVVKVVKTDRSFAAPVLATFPQNIPEPKEDIAFEVFRKKKVANIRSTNSPIPYLGKHRANLDSSRYLLGFFDEPKKKLVVYPVEHTFEIHRILHTDKRSDLVGLNANVEGIEHREMIVQEIGTKKGKKIFQQIKNKVIKEDAIFSAPEIKEIMVQKAEEIQNEIDNNSLTHFQKELERKKEILPEFNLSAKSGAKIYNIDGVMPPSEVEDLDVGLLEDERFVVPYCKEINTTTNWSSLTPEQASHKKKMLAYLNCLLLFFKIRKIDLTVAEIAQNRRVPLSTAKAIVNRFYEPLKREHEAGVGVSFSRSKKQDTRLTCYILILCLHIQAFKINLTPLMNTLRIEEDRLALLAREVGCNVSKGADGKNVAKLKKLRIETEDKYAPKS